MLLCVLCGKSLLPVFLIDRTDFVVGQRYFRPGWPGYGGCWFQDKGATVWVRLLSRIVEKTVVKVYHGQRLRK